MQRTRPILAIAFSLLIASSMVVVPASAAFTESTAQPTPHSGTASPAPLDAATTGASALDHTTADDVPEIGGETPRDLDGDGRYEDVNGDGSLSNGDVTHFFGHQHLPPAQEHVEYFDFDGNGDVGQSDVVQLFDALSADDSTDVVVPVEPTDTDEDGLPDRFEANVAGTDPHDANSSSTLTAANESQNDALDGAEDLSGNGVPLAYAAEYDLDPLENDTDGDGLPDDVEIMQSDLDPTAADSNGDGTPDGEGDLDDDGLTNAEEAERGTAIRRADSDGDGLEDGEEADFGSDPLERDTDGDGLDDGLEQRLGTDPTSTDSDGDGTPDNEETFELEHADEATGVTATATGQGAAPTELSVRHLPRYDNTSDATAGPTVLVENVEEQDSVTVSVPVATDASAEDLSVYTREPTRNGTWEEHGGEYDAAAGVATAELPGAREVTVLNATTWKDSQSLSVYEASPVDNISATCEGDCVIDNGSIVVGPEASDLEGSDSDGVSTLGLNSGFLIGPSVPNPVDAVRDVLSDDSDDSDDESGEESDDSSTGSGGAVPRHPPDDYDPGGDSSSSDDDGSSDSDSSYFGGSDGDDSGSDDTGDDSNTDDVSSSATVSIPVEPEAVTLTIGYNTVGGDGDATITIDGPTDGSHLDADATYGDSEIISADVTEFGGEEITVSLDASDDSARIEGLSVFHDSDGDGLVDVFEEQSHTHPQTRREFRTDPNRADKDGDGIEDGEEVSASFNGEWWTLESATTDPSLPDTDGDGLTDSEELEGWEIQVVDDHDDAEALQRALDEESPEDVDVSQYFTTKHVDSDPTTETTSEDGLDDGEERRLGTDPESEDTTGDGIEDGDALDARTEDPTVFTTTAPKASDVRRVSKQPVASDEPVRDFLDPRDLPVDWEFTYEYRVEDDVGVARTRFSQESHELETESYDGPTTVTEERTLYSNSEALMEYLRGADVRVYTEDVYGNDRSQRFRVRQPLGYRIADSAIVRTDVTLGGMVSGFTQGAAELPDFALMVYNEPRQTGANLAELSNQIAQAEICADRAVPSGGYAGADLRSQGYPCDYLAEETEGEVPDSRGEFWAELAYSMEEAIHEDQHRANPQRFEGDAESGRERFTHCLAEYDGQSVGVSEADQSDEVDLERLPYSVDGDYCDYAVGWYQGYALWAVVESVAGSKGAVKGASSVEDATDVVESAGRKVDEGVGRSIAGNHEGPTPRIAKQVATDGGNPAIDYDGVVGKLSDRGYQSGKIQGATSKLDRIDGPIDDLDTAEQATLAARLQESADPDAAVEFVESLEDTSDVRRLLEEDGATMNRLVKWHSNPDAFSHIDPDVTASDYIHLAQNADIDETHLVVKGTDEMQPRGEVQWLENGYYHSDIDNGVGMVKIRDKHGIELNEQYGVRTSDEIESLISQAIKNPTEIRENPGGGTRYYKSVDEGAEPLRVAVSENGFILSAHPDETVEL